jgi:hypothetical protein
MSTSSIPSPFTSPGPLIAKPAKSKLSMPRMMKPLLPSPPSLGSSRRNGNTAGNPVVRPNMT